MAQLHEIAELPADPEPVSPRGSGLGWYGSSRKPPGSAISQISSPSLTHIVIVPYPAPCSTLFAAISDTLITSDVTRSPALGEG
ncbi:hypothetical protein [Nonomuraea helvata]|uniref:Uncharacterized protein n=1 Tax=Nonomuraea helvata TaxID=37484 RepID=A0ABV5RYT2_9ACTN